MPVTLPVFTMPDLSVGAGMIASLQSLGAELGQPPRSTCRTVVDLGVRSGGSLPGKHSDSDRELEFIEMSALLQEAWASLEPSEGNPLFKPHGQRALVVNILVWAECFAGMATILSRKYPSKGPELFAYTRRVFHAARNYEGHVWVAYDRMYRRQATLKCSLDWSQEDQAVYNEAFAGRAKQSVRCRHCLSEHHSVDA